MVLPGSEPKTVLHAGNNKGEVYLYEIDLGKKQKTDDKTGQVLQSPLRLLDMIITDQGANSGATSTANTISSKKEE